MKGTVFSIEEFSVYDGPGIRTTVFLKGCPLHCSWCHNPEGQRYESEIVCSPNGCLHCGRCREHAVSENGVLRFTEASIRACPRGLLRVCGEEYEAEALCKRLLKNRELLVGGGVTFSGGEPLWQGDFVLECLSRLKGEVHTAVQTTGFCNRALFESVLAKTDYVLYDLKLIDDSRHRFHTGVSNRLILENFKALATSGVDFTVRTPLIPGVTDTEENLSAIAMLLREYGIGRIELLPYNKMAGGKYKMLLRQYTPTFDETQEPVPRVPLFEAYSVHVEIL